MATMFWMGRSAYWQVTMKVTALPSEPHRGGMSSLVMVMLFNPDGCWNPLIQALQVLEDQHYIRSGYTRSIVCIDRIDEAIHWLEQQDQ